MQILRNGKQIKNEVCLNQDFQDERCLSRWEDDLDRFMSKALHTQFNLCLTFLVKYVFMFRNGFGTAQSKGVQLATALLYSICVSVEARVASKDFVNFVIGKP